MVKRANLTVELVRSLDPPKEGEFWIADLAVKGLGVRAWSGKRGGNIGYAIRCRDSRGRLVREAFTVWSNDQSRRKIRQLLNEGQYEWPPELFLDEARVWARDRLKKLRGGLTSRELRELRYDQASKIVRSFTLDQMAERTIKKLRRSDRNETYVDSISVIYRHVSEECRSALLEDIDAKKLARDIANRNIPDGSSRILQAFIGQVFKDASRWYGPLGLKSKAIQRRTYSIRQNQEVPPHPAILDISKEDIDQFLKRLENDEENWRASLAIRLYFGTGAKMRRVLSAQWDHLIEGKWYPYSPAEKKYWFNGSEEINTDTERVIKIVRDHHKEVSLISPFLFPSLEHPAVKPITTIQRCWRYWSRQFGWDGLPLSHVVLRYRRRNTPSYVWSQYTLFTPMFQNHVLKPDTVSKVYKAHKVNPDN